MIKEQDLVIYSCPEISNKLIFLMEGVNCVSCLSPGGLMAEGKGRRQRARRVPSWLLGLDLNLHWDLEKGSPSSASVSQCIRSLVSLKAGRGLKRG